MRILFSLFILLIAGASAGAQQIGQNKPADAQQNFTLSVKVQLVVEAVVVKDKDGKPIEGLTAKDFAVTRTAFRKLCASASTRIWPSWQSLCRFQNKGTKTSSCISN